MNEEDMRKALRDAGVHADLAAGDVWDTAGLQRDFEVRGFLAPYVVVTRRVDNVVGSLRFIHSPRVYYAWRAD